MVEFSEQRNGETSSFFYVEKDGETAFTVVVLFFLIGELENLN